MTFTLLFKVLRVKLVPSKVFEKYRLLQRIEVFYHVDYFICFICSQVCELTGELCSVQEERDNLVSSQAAPTEDVERLKGEAVKTQEELERMQKDLADAGLKEVQLIQQHTEVTEQLAQAQEDLQHHLEENRSLLSALEEAKQKVRAFFYYFFCLLYWCLV